MIHSRSIAILLSLVLTAVAVPAAGACATESALSDHSSAHGDPEPERCHDPAPDASKPLPQDCPDCSEHCPAQAQAALQANVRLKVIDIPHSMLPDLGGIDPVAIATRLFRPPTFVPLAHSNNT